MLERLTNVSWEDHVIVAALVNMFNGTVDVVHASSYACHVVTTFPFARLPLITLGLITLTGEVMYKLSLVLFCIATTEEHTREITRDTNENLDEKLRNHDRCEVANLPKFLQTKFSLDPYICLDVRYGCKSNSNETCLYEI